MEFTRVFIDIFDNVDTFLLVFVRVIGFLLLAPIFSGQTVPTMAKIGFSFCISIIAITGGFLIEAPVYSGFLGLFLLILAEFLTGFIISFVVYFMFAVFYYVGQLADYQIGFSMVSIYDPVNQIQAPVTGNLYYFVFLAYFLVFGGLNFLIYLFFQTYYSIPLGEGFIIGNNGVLSFIVDMMATYLELGFKIAMPIIATIIIVDAALGILVKAVPQMNVFVVGMPLKLLIGLMVLYLTVPMLEDIVYSEFSNNLFYNLTEVIRGISP